MSGRWRNSVGVNILYQSVEKVTGRGSSSTTAGAQKEHVKLLLHEN